MLQLGFSAEWRTVSRKFCIFRDLFASFLHFVRSRKNCANILRKKCENSRKSQQNVTEKFRLFSQNVSFAGNLQFTGYCCKSSMPLYKLRVSRKNVFNSPFNINSVLFTVQYYSLINSEHPSKRIGQDNFFQFFG